jgi:hypothetical protein
MIYLMIGFQLRGGGDVERCRYTRLHYTLVEVALMTEIISLMEWLQQQSESPTSWLIISY